MVSQEFSLKGKTALIAGDSKYWSKYAAKALAEAGADVALSARNNKHLEEAADEIQKQNRKALIIPTETNNTVNIQRVLGQVLNEFGRIDILVNASDFVFAKPFLQISEKEWRQVMDENLMPAFLYSQAVVKPMKEQSKGRIINLISCMAERGVENFTAYCTSMGGVLQLTRALNLEVARHGITVNAIGTAWISEVEKTGDAAEELVLKYLPLKRYGKPDEIDSLLVYLASDTSSFFTGQFLYVDGAVMSHP